MKTDDDNIELTAKPVPQLRSSQAALALGAVVVAAFLMILLTAFCYWLLPLEVARELSGQIWEMIKNAATGASVLGAGGLAIRGLMLTQERIKNNSPERSEGDE